MANKNLEKFKKLIDNYQPHHRRIVMAYALNRLDLSEQMEAAGYACYTVPEVGDAIYKAHDDFLSARTEYREKINAIIKKYTPEEKRWTINLADIESAN